MNTIRLISILDTTNIVHLWRFKGVSQNSSIALEEVNIMNCIYLKDAKYLGDFKSYLQFNDGLQGEVDTINN